MPFIPTTALLSSGGGATVATTVAGLGAGVDGKLGLLRVGSSPYDFMPLIYDATYGKWVSTEFSEHMWPATSALQTQTDIIAVTEFSPAAQPPFGAIVYKLYKDAGLTLQGRIGVFVGSDPGKTANFQIGYRTFNAGASSSGSAAFDATVTTQAAGAGVAYKDTGWISLAPTNADYFTFSFGAFRQSGGAGISITFQLPRVHWRWVS